MKYTSTEEAQQDHIKRYRSDGVKKGKGTRYSSDYYRVCFVTDNVKAIGKVLDVGCNAGTIGLPLQAKGCYVNGIDIVEELVEKAKKNGIMAKVGAAEKLDFPCDYFDYVTCCEVLEHLYDPMLAIAEAYRVLKPGGSYVVTIPHQEGSTGGVGDYHNMIFSAEIVDTMFHNFFIRGNVRVASIPYIPEYCKANNIDPKQPQWLGVVAIKT